MVKALFAFLSNARFDLPAKSEKEWTAAERPTLSGRRLAEGQRHHLGVMSFVFANVLPPVGPLDGPVGVEGEVEARVHAGHVGARGGHRHVGDGLERVLEPHDLLGGVVGAEQLQQAVVVADQNARAGDGGQQAAAVHAPAGQAAAGADHQELGLDGVANHRHHAALVSESTRKKTSLKGRSPETGREEKT
eukprot:scaffold107740_cov25-Prasinocladus_malaysianus.AAC.2